MRQNDFLSTLGLTLGLLFPNLALLAPFRARAQSPHAGPQLEIKLRSLEVTHETPSENLSTLDAKTLVQRLENLERLCTKPGDKKMREYIRAKMSRIGAELSRRLEDSGFETANAPAPHWDLKSWHGEKAWLQALETRKPEERCELLALAYGTAVYRVSTLDTPTPNQRELPAKIKRDVERASWEFRYFQSPKVKGFAQACPRFVNDAQARNDFILHARQAPQGSAADSCGRPMNAYGLDDIFTNDLEKAPPEWEFPKSEDEVDRIESGDPMKIKMDIDIGPKKATVSDRPVEGQ
jgi:hypothetical protein